MTILLINLCFNNDEISKSQFIDPIINIIKSDYKIKHYLELDNVNFSNYNKIILCGTYLKDFSYLDNLDKFNFIKTFNGFILGICAGSQVLAKIYDAKLVEGEQIGFINLDIIKLIPLLENVNFNEVYSLHTKTVLVNKNIIPLALSKDFIEIFKIKNNDFYGISFHPEVRNKELIQNFINL